MGKYTLYFALICAIAIFIWQMIRFKKGETLSDELSKKIRIKSKAVSFHFAIFFWLLLMIFGERLNMDISFLAIGGMLGTIFSYYLTWLFFRFIGMRYV